MSTQQRRSVVIKSVGRGLDAKLQREGGGRASLVRDGAIDGRGDDRESRAPHHTAKPASAQNDVAQACLPNHFCWLRGVQQATTARWPSHSPLTGTRP